ncbi:hypothetical protein AOZ07_13275 [Glutamicibacter halophytocola]|uniref:hypothetical protein n=1 Tax=Glutamicibacter halophytocola TaxID=1933880 RepID=UPI0006D49A90|nr:hypothetical protein [Glutamicibacter halophytocola]ALG29852.1 hypothetical protein AOZ07_13275 [Glutamicibacter halophytocola]
MPKKMTVALALCAALALSGCSSTQAQMPQDQTHKKAAEATASPSPSESARQLTTAEVATTAGAVLATELGFPNSAKIQGKDLEALATPPTDTLKDIVVLPAQCSAPINDLNWSPVQLGTEAARTDFTNENQSITGSVEVAKLGANGAAAVDSHNKNVRTIVEQCKSAKLNGMDYTETLKFSDPQVDSVDSALYYSRDGQYAQNSLVLIKKTKQYAVMVSFVAGSSLADEKFNKVATSVMDAAIAQLP